MNLYLFLALAQFTFVFLKAFQQRNVTWNNFTLVIPTSFAMAACEVYLVYNVAQAGWSFAVVMAVGFASGIGAVSAMALHNSIYKENGLLHDHYQRLAEAARERVRKLLGRR